MDNIVLHPQNSKDKNFLVYLTEKGKEYLRMDNGNIVYFNDIAELDNNFLKSISVYQIFKVIFPKGN